VAAVQVIGRNLAGLRAVSAGSGVMTVLALILLAQELFGRRTALLAAAMLAVYPPHIQFSRLALNNVADPFFGTMALYFMARGINTPPQPSRLQWLSPPQPSPLLWGGRRGRGDIRFNFALAGAMLGLTQYFYEGGRFLLPALVLGWLGFVAVSIILNIISAEMKRGVNRADSSSKFDHARLHDLAKAATILLLVAAIVGAPVYYTLLARDKALAMRLEMAGLTPANTVTITG
jgi:hypothetical protein